MKNKLLVEAELPLTEEGIAHMRENGCDVIFTSGEGQDALLDALDHTVTAILIRKSSNYKIDDTVFDKAPNLKVVSRFGVGTEIFDIPAAEKRKIRITNAPTSNMNATAEHAMYLILALAKNGLRLDKMTRSGWFHGPDEKLNLELKDSVLGIIGVGRIGSLTAAKAYYGFGMKVIGYDPFCPKDRFPEYVERSESLEDILKRSDFVSLHTVATPENWHLINKERLSLMKPTAFLVNVSRGSVVSEGDLYQALKEGIIAGAGIDVYEFEPPTDSKYFELENVIVSPHYAATTASSIKNAEHDCLSDILAVMREELPKWEVTRF